MGLLEFLRRIFLGKKRKAGKKKHRIHKKTAARKHKRAKLKPVRKINKVGAHRKHKAIPKPKRKARPHKRKQVKRKHHEHKAELKVAERATSDDLKYATKPKSGKVSLRVREEGSPDYEYAPDQKHTFKFRRTSEKKLKYAAVKEAKKNIPEKPHAFSKSELKKKNVLKKISEILKRKMDQNLIITNLDMIEEIVKTLGKVRIDYVAEALMIDEKIAEELAFILERNNIIEIHYPVFGKKELIRREEKNEKSDQ